MIVGAPDAALAEALSRLHAAAFDGAARPWAAAEIAALAGAPGAALAVTGDPPQGFGLIRVAADEAELLTLAVAAEARRRGVASALLDALEARARADGAATVWLEVAADNAAARALYEARGFLAAGRRGGYYARPGAPAVDALALRKSL